MKQQSFTVEFDDEEAFDFRAQPVRAAVVRESAVSFEFEGVPEGGGTHLDVLGRTLAVSSSAQGLTRLVETKQAFRFFPKDPWQRAVLRAAQELGMIFSVQANTTMSTCTLKHRFHEVTTELDWVGLAREVVISLGEQLEVKREGPADDACADAGRKAA
jgi:hypothetical protein